MSRVVVLAFNYSISARIQRFVHELVTHGTEVDLVVADRRCVAELELDPRVCVHPVWAAEPFLVRLEQFLLFRLPGRLLAGTRRLVGRNREGQRLDRILTATGRGHERLARVIHRGAFMPVYRNVRPLLLARKFDSRTGVDVAGADLIVAGDLSAVALGWRLARRYPDNAATMALDSTRFRRVEAPV